MRKNRIALVLVVLLGILSVWFIMNKRRGTISEEMKTFAVKDTMSITKIFLADKNGRTVTLERKHDGTWSLNQKYNARMDLIKTLLTTIARVDVKEPVAKKAQDNIIKDLAARAIKCEIYQNGELTKAYFVGSETRDYTGTYMIMIDPETMETAERPFVTYIPGFEGYLTTRYSPDEHNWRDRTVFQYVPNNIKSVKLETPQNAALGFELIVKADNNFEIRTLADNKELAHVDPLAVKQFLSYFQRLDFENFESRFTKEQIDSVLKTQPANIITVTDKSGAINKVKFYPRKAKKGATDEKGNLTPYDPERMNALLNNGVDFVVVQYFAFGKVMPSVEYFQQKAIPMQPGSVPPGAPKP